MVPLSALPSQVELDPATAALFVIDMQHDFLSEGGWADAVSLDYLRLRRPIASIARAIDAARRVGMQIVFTREAHRPDLADCPPRKRGRRTPGIGDPGPRGRYLIAGEPGNAVIEAFDLQSGDWAIDKPGKGSFFATPLEHLLRTSGIKQIVLTGVTADVCVHATTFEANDRGFDCIVLEDAVESFDDDLTAGFIKMMRRGTLGYATTTDAFVDALQAAR